MKKLLVLALVLSVASLASAGLSLTPGASGFTVDSDVNVGAFAFVAVEASIVGDLDLTALADGGSLSFINSYGLVPAGGFVPSILVDTYVWEINVAGAPTPVDAGAWAQYTSDQIFATGEGAAWLVADDAATILGTLAAVPEPTTMALLGLGALVLRRKK